MNAESVTATPMKVQPPTPILLLLCCLLPHAAAAATTTPCGNLTRNYGDIWFEDNRPKKSCPVSTCEWRLTAGETTSDKFLHVRVVLVKKLQKLTLPDGSFLLLLLSFL